MTHKVAKSIAHEIVYHLKNNDPQSAKSAYDQWVMKNSKNMTEKDIFKSILHDYDAIDLFN